VENERLGQINITQQLIDSNPDRVLEIFNKISFLPLRIREVWEQGKLVYIGYSPEFEIVKHGEHIPMYRVQLTMQIDDEGNRTIHDCALSLDNSCYSQIIYPVSIRGTELLD